MASKNRNRGDIIRIVSAPSRIAWRVLAIVALFVLAPIGACLINDSSELKAIALIYAITGSVLLCCMAINMAIQIARDKSRKTTRMCISFAIDYLKRLDRENGL